MKPNRTPRQAREIAYHSVHASKLRARLAPISDAVLLSPHRRWWNATWCMYDILLAKDLRNKTALIVGCGPGDDAILLAKLGAHVQAFDISPDMISLAKVRAAEESLDIEFRIMSAESLSYPGSTFDVILVRDTLHHIEVEAAFAELLRVSKDDCFIVINELYTHSILQRIRESLFGNWLHAKVVPLIYKSKELYITEDERKLDETELRLLQQAISGPRSAYFQMLVLRFVPDSWITFAKIDRLVMRGLGSLGYIFAGRFLLSGQLKKE